MTSNHAAETPSTLRSACLGLLLVLFVAPASRAQQPPPPPEGTVSGNYNIQQSLEVGWRFDDRAGSDPAFNTFVDLHSGPRMLAQTLDVHSLNHHGLLFDTLSLSSFGYGGDPNLASRLRVQKNRWYNLNASFRRSHNFWDFDLFANPLNPANSKPSQPVADSPHRFDLARRATDVNLMLAPQSRVRARLGYSRSLQVGPAFDSVHDGVRTGVELLLLAPWHTAQDNYQAGVDFKLLPRTNISFDQFVAHIKDERSERDAGFGFQLPNGTPYDLGLVFDTKNFQPCSSPVTNPATQPPTAGASCAGAIGFTRDWRYHATNPSEQVSFQSNYFRDLEISGRALYSSAQLDLASSDELFAGFVPLELRRQTGEHSSGSARRITASADLGATWEPKEGLRLSDTFHYAAFRIPGGDALTAASLFALSATAAIVSGCKPPFTPANCPIHTQLSPPDFLSEIAARFLGQSSAGNEVQIEYDFWRHFGARLGHRFRRRDIDTRSLVVDTELFLPLLPTRNDCAGQPIAPDGSCTTVVTNSAAHAVEINENSLLLGAWATATDRLRANFDLEFTGTDNTFTRMDARRRQQERGRVNYRPADWADITVAANRNDSSNGAADVNAAQHHRGFSANAMLARGERWGVQLAYDWSSDRTHADICYTVAQPPAGAPPCLSDPVLLRATAFDQQAVHFGSAALRWQPLARVTASAGYSLVHADGSFLALDPLAVPGALRSRFARPNASLAVALNRTLTWKTAWGRTRYDEDSATGPTLPRSFRADLFTLSLRYGF